VEAAVAVGAAVTVAAAAADCPLPRVARVTTGGYDYIIRIHLYGNIRIRIYQVVQIVVYKQEFTLIA
jgi:hypothetical protein